MGHRGTRPGPPRCLERRPRRQRAVHAAVQGVEEGPLGAVAQPPGPDPGAAGQAELAGQNASEGAPRVGAQGRTAGGVHPGPPRRQDRGQTCTAAVDLVGAALPHPRIRGPATTHHRPPGSHPHQHRPRPEQRAGRKREHQAAAADQDGVRLRRPARVDRPGPTRPRRPVPTSSRPGTTGVPRTPGRGKEQASLRSVAAGDPLPRPGNQGPVTDCPTEKTPHTTREIKNVFRRNDQSDTPTEAAGGPKICSYFPYQIKVWVNGHEWAKRQALAAGIGFTALDNGFASTSDPAALQAICDAFTPGTVNVWFERWMAKLPLPLTTADRDAGFWWDLSMRQIETSRTLVFDQDVHARAFFEALLRDNMDLGRPENVELLFRRGQRSGRPTNPPDGGFKTKIDRCCELITLNVFYRNSRLKQYLKDGVALRIETVVNDPKDLRCNRLLANLPQLQDKARAINNRLLDTETVGQGTTLVSPVIERTTKPTVTDD